MNNQIKPKLRTAFPTFDISPQNTSKLLNFSIYTESELYQFDVLPKPAQVGLICRKLVELDFAGADIELTNLDGAIKYLENENAIYRINRRNKK